MPSHIVSLDDARRRAAEWQRDHDLPDDGQLIAFDPTREMNDQQHAIKRFSWSPLNSLYTYDGEQHRLHQQAPKRKRLAIVCGAPTRAQAPLDDPKVEVWALNLCMPLDRARRIRADVWFELHPERAQSPTDGVFIAQNERPCFHVDTDIDAPCPMELRYRNICEQWGWPVYFPNSIAFMVMYAAHCLKENPDRWDDVELYGVELLMGNPRERTVEAAGVSFWLGIIWELTEVYAPEIDGGMLFHPHVYGYDYEAEMRHVQLLLAAHRESDVTRRELELRRHGGMRSQQ